MLLTEFTRPNRFTPDEKKALSHRAKRLTSDENDMSEFGYSTSAKYHTITKKLSLNGWRSIDSGYYSKVFVNPSKDYIIKLNINRDVGFLWFMFLTRKFPNVHFPKMMDVKILFQEENGKALYAYKMEKLRSLTLNENTRLIIRRITDAIDDISRGTYKNVDEYIQKEKDRFGMPILKDYLKSNPEMKEAMTVIGKYSKGPASIDLIGNTSNFMQRTDGTIVINDPFAS